MTTDEFGSVDIDLLADFIGDALDEPDRGRVARLVADDPEWRSAFALLTPGMSEVGAELRAMGAAPEAMPADLGVRLDAAFAADPATEHELIAAELTEPGEPHLQPSRGDRHLVSVPSGRSVTTTPRRRRLRWAAPIAAAAGVLAFAGFGTTYLTTGGDDSAQSTAAGGAAEAPQAAAEDAAGLASGLVSGVAASQILASGTDYTPDTLKSGPAATMMAPSEAEKASGNSSQRAQAPPAAADLAGTGLARLRDQAALLACLEAIALQNAAGPITVQSVDYARFAGAAALIVRFSAAGTSWAWATGPDCGAPGRGAQVRQRVQVG
jgi:hypothetical protein